MRVEGKLTVEEIEALLKLDGLKLSVYEGYVFNAYIRGTYIFPTIRGTGVTAQEAANSAWRKYADNRRD